MTRSSARRPRALPRRRFMPALFEILEGRVVPSTLPVSAALVSEVVNKADPFVTLSKTAVPAVGGYQFTFTAVVGLALNDASLPPPTGTVTFSQGSTVLGTVPVNNSQATLTTILPGAGSEQVTALYSGDSQDNPATSPSPLGMVLSPVTITTLTSSNNPASYDLGTMFTATVIGLAPPPSSSSPSVTPPLPTGTVTFLDGTTFLGTAPVIGGQANFTTTMLVGGSHQITATYGGDTSYDPSTSPPLTQVVTPAQTSTRVSTSFGTTSFGIPLLLSAAVDDFVISGNGTLPTGTITFYDGMTPLGTSPLNGPGGATLSLQALPAGTHAISASYSGDANFQASSSTATALTVNPVLTSVALTTPLSPISPYQAVTLSAILSPTPAGTQTPTGSVAFFDGTTLLGLAPLSGNTATLNVTGLPVGVQALTAKYAGDGNFLAGNSASAQIVSGNANERFLNQLYLDLMHRPIDGIGLVGWEALLNAGASRGTIALGIEASREFALTTLKGFSQSLLGQAPTTSMVDQAIWLQVKNLSDPTSLKAIVLNSPEFYQVRGGGTSAGFVAAVSQAVTGRPTDPSQLANLLSMANVGNRAGVVSSVLGSLIALELQVVYDYHGYLVRTPEAGAVPYFVNQLEHGVSSAAVIAQFVGSPEYFKNATTLPTA